jgi:hypothetical protein
MPGVYRPTTLVDVLRTITQGNSASAGTFTGLAQFAEADETTTITGTVTTSVQTPAGWDQGTWGTTVWG